MRAASEFDSGPALCFVRIAVWIPGLELEIVPLASGGYTAMNVNLEGTESIYAGGDSFHRHRAADGGDG